MPSSNANTVTVFVADIPRVLYREEVKYGTHYYGPKDALRGIQKSLAAVLPTTLRRKIDAMVLQGDNNLNGDLELIDAKRRKQTPSEFVQKLNERTDCFMRLFVDVSRDLFDSLIELKTLTLGCHVISFHPLSDHRKKSEDQPYAFTLRTNGFDPLTKNIDFEHLGDDYKTPRNLRFKQSAVMQELNRHLIAKGHSERIIADRVTYRGSEWNPVRLAVIGSPEPGFFDSLSEIVRSPDFAIAGVVSDPPLSLARIRARDLNERRGRGERRGARDGRRGRSASVGRLNPEELARVNENLRDELTRKEEEIAELKTHFRRDEYGILVPIAAEVAVGPDAEELRKLQMDCISYKMHIDNLRETARGNGHQACEFQIRKLTDDLLDLQRREHSDSEVGLFDATELQTSLEPIIKERDDLRDELLAVKAELLAVKAERDAALASNSGNLAKINGMLAARERISNGILAMTHYHENAVRNVERTVYDFKNWAMEFNEMDYDTYLNQFEIPADVEAEDDSAFQFGTVEDTL